MQHPCKRPKMWGVPVPPGFSVRQEAPKSENFTFIKPNDLKSFASCLDHLIAIYKRIPGYINEQIDQRRQRYEIDDFLSEIYLTEINRKLDHTFICLVATLYENRQYSRQINWGWEPKLISTVKKQSKLQFVDYSLDHRNFLRVVTNNFVRCAVLCTCVSIREPFQNFVPTSETARFERWRTRADFPEELHELAETIAATICSMIRKLHTNLWSYRTLNRMKSQEACTTHCNGHDVRIAVEHTSDYLNPQARFSIINPPNDFSAYQLTPTANFTDVFSCSIRQSVNAFKQPSNVHSSSLASKGRQRAASIDLSGKVLPYRHWPPNQSYFTVKYPNSTSSNHAKLNNSNAISVANGQQTGEKTSQHAIVESQQLSLGGSQEDSNGKCDLIVIEPEQSSKPTATIGNTVSSAMSTTTSSSVEKPTETPILQSLLLQPTPLTYEAANTDTCKNKNIQTKENGMATGTVDTEKHEQQVPSTTPEDHSPTLLHENSSFVPSDLMSSTSHSLSGESENFPLESAPQEQQTSNSSCSIAISEPDSMETNEIEPLNNQTFTNASSATKVQIEEIVVHDVDENELHEFSEDSGVTLTTSPSFEMLNRNTENKASTKNLIPASPTPQTMLSEPISITTHEVEHRIQTEMAMKTEHDDQKSTFSEIKIGNPVQNAVKVKTEAGSSQRPYNTRKRQSHRAIRRTSARKSSASSRNSNYTKTLAPIRAYKTKSTTESRISSASRAELKRLEKEILLKNWIPERILNHKVEKRTLKLQIKWEDALLWPKEFDALKIVAKKVKNYAYESALQMGNGKIRVSWADHSWEDANVWMNVSAVCKKYVQENKLDKLLGE